MAFHVKFLSKIQDFWSLTMSDIQTQLATELAPMDWETLIPHAKRDAVIVVDEALDLLEVGVAIALLLYQKRRPHDRGLKNR
jgi:hypothetical protein